MDDGWIGEWMYRWMGEWMGGFFLSFLLNRQLYPFPFQNKGKDIANFSLINKKIFTFKIHLKIFMSVLQLHVCVCVCAL